MEKIISPPPSMSCHYLGVSGLFRSGRKSATKWGLLTLTIWMPILSPATPVLPIELCRSEVSAFPVTGRVTDENGESLPGVSIIIKNTSSGTITDADGKFEIEVNDNQTILVFSFVGYISQEVTAGNSNQLNIKLVSDEKSLNEVVVIGYGSAKKSDLTGSVGQLDVGSAIKAPVGSIGEAMAGRISGVQISSNDGQPGGNVNIMIRGAGSLTQSTSPLYVVDDFPIENLDLKTLNPEDIKSITVLKDASSTAIYGSRAANGVIVITTKRGAESKPVISLSSSVGFQYKPQEVELMSPYEFVKYQLEINPTNSVTQSYLTDGRTLDYYKDVEGINWQDKVLRTGAVKINNVSIRGGSATTQYSVSGSAYNQDGVIINTGYSRYSGRVTLDQTLSKKLKAGVTTNYSGVTSFGQQINAGSSGPSSTVLFRMWAYRPLSPKEGVNLEEELVDADAVNTSDFRVNPFIDLENQHQYSYTKTLDANAYLTYEIIPGLIFKSNGGFRSINTKHDRFYNSKTSQGSPFNPSNINGINGSVSQSAAEGYSFENSLNYNVTLHNDHHFSALALFSINGTETRSNGYSARMLPNENLKMDGIDQGVVFNPLSSTAMFTMASYAGRLDYNYKSKYLATLTFRADGTSKFPDPWGYFPGLALGWNMSNESFFKEIFPAVSTSKIRASYGSTGNNRVGEYAYHPSITHNINGYSFNNATPIPGVYVSAVGNSELRWEKVNTMDIGYEFGLFDNRLALEIDLYKKTTNDLLLNAQLPPTSGFTTAYKNIGKLENKGLEITLKTTNIARKNFTWSSDFNISFNRNKILELTRGQQFITANGQYESHFNKPLYLSEIGKPAGMMIGFIFDGIYQYEHFDNPSPDVYILKNHLPTNGSVRNTIQPGDIRYKDLNNDGIINDDDMTIIGRGQPIHIGGLANSFQYKGFSLNMLLQWSYGNNIMNANRLALEGNSNMRAMVNQFATYADRWTPENPSNEHYRTRGQGPVGFYSSKTVEDGSYLRLKTLSLEYSIPQSLTNRWLVRDITFSVASQNVLTWTRYSGLDPEVSILNQVLSPGFDYSAYPMVRTLTFGMKAIF